MEPSSTIYVAGHGGLVGSAIARQLRASGYNNLVLRTHEEVDLTQQEQVQHFFEQVKPHYVFLAAAKVGGIYANDTYPAEFIQQNLAIQTNVIHESWRHGVKRLLFLGSSCIYPRDCPQPIREEYLLTGPLEPTNQAYAIAKIAGVEMCRAYNRQYDTRYLAAMPTNLYGLGDNYDLLKSHVLPALIRKMQEAKERGDKEVMIWGTGNPRREFLFSEDMADACVSLMRLNESEFQSLTQRSPPLVNIGCGEDLTIKALAQLIATIVDFEATLRYDSSKPDGTPRKLLDVSLIRSFGWQPQTTLEEGIKLSWQEYLSRRGQFC